MVLARTNDAVVMGFTPARDVRFIFADVTETTRKLAAAHGLSIKGAAILGKALAGVAVLHAFMEHANAQLCLTATLSGRAAGFHVEINANGYLRGYLQEKSPETLIPPKGTDPDDLCGDNAIVKLSILRDNGEIHSQITSQIPSGNPENICQALLKSIGPCRLALSADEIDGRLFHVYAIAIVASSNCTKQTFETFAEHFKNGYIRQIMGFGVTLRSFRYSLGIPELETAPSTELRIGCDCSLKKVLNAYASEPRSVLESWIRSNATRTFQCHLCGKKYAITPTMMAELLLRNPPAKQDA
ncbi:MAG: Hsp33 family molecular chaperone HslO [Kiritimatiellia bacterium]